MANCHVKMENCDPKIIATELRKTANGFDPWGAVRSAAFWFTLGGVIVAAMDYGDVWVCVGQCNAATHLSQ
jgi:hypothetical protein